MTNPTERPERDSLARAFHETYERLAPEYGYETRRESAVPWEQVPENNRRLMQAVVAEVVGPLEAEVKELREENAALDKNCTKAERIYMDTVANLRAEYKRECEQMEEALRESERKLGFLKAHPDFVFCKQKEGTLHHPLNASCSCSRPAALSPSDTEEEAPR